MRLHSAAVPQRLERRRHRLVTPNRGDQEQQVGVDELAEQRRRRVVEQMQVVDEQHRRSVGALLEQDRADLRDDGDEVAAFVSDVRRQHVRERAER